MRLVLTGSSMGIGHALADHLLAAGHQVWGLSRSDQSDRAASHSDFRFSVCDVSDYSSVNNAADAVADHWAGIEGLITCAGIQGEVGRTLASDPARWCVTMRANLEGTYNALRAFAPLLLCARLRAKVICFSGGGATKARANFSAYGSAKTAIVRLVETIAAEERGRPLDINAIAPGAINTRLTDEVIRLGPDIAGEDEYEAALRQKQTGGSSMAKVCGLVDWLLSPESDGITGRLISAQWDAWDKTEEFRTLATGDHYTLRRVLPERSSKGS
jgi:NAD(P)-dependent dehydrogenase (short-subunit alcohol dehydrogenase family)